MNPISLWPSLIYKAHYDGDLVKIEKILLSLCRSTCDFQNILDRSEFHELKTWIEDNSKKIWLEMGLVDRWPLKIHHSLCNYQPPGSCYKEHSNGISQLVAVVYIKHSENSGNLLFKNPLQIQFASWPKNNQMVDWVPLSTITGDVLFFPGFMIHKSEENKSLEDQLILEANLILDMFHNHLK